MLPAETQFLLGHVSVQTTERYLGCKQRIRGAVNNRIGIEPLAGRLRRASATLRPSEFVNAPPLIGAIGPRFDANFKAPFGRQCRPSGYPYRDFAPVASSHIAEPRMAKIGVASNLLLI
jgi:hypothetical protein